MEKGKYNVMIINPEILMGNDDVEKLWKKPEFTKWLLNFVFDEGHCISQWGSFRKEYAHLKPARRRICHAGPKRPWVWDPTLGLISDLRAHRVHFPAAALSRAQVLSFVYLFTPINDHIIRFVIPLIVCRDSSSDTSGCILEPGK